MQFFVKMAKILGFFPEAQPTCADILPAKTEPQPDHLRKILTTPLIDLPEAAEKKDQYVTNPVDVVKAWAKANNQDQYAAISLLENTLKTNLAFQENTLFPPDEFTKRLLLNDVIRSIIKESPEAYLGRHSIDEQEKDKQSIYA